LVSLIQQYEFNTNPGPYFVPRNALPETEPQSYPVRFIAFYLPQFHAVPENDQWWGKGFTEWTNVTKALPQYVGHFQPRLPADLGFYDASTLKALEAQAELARLGGVYGFCIHDYWFGGRKILEAPVTVLLDNPQIKLNFCLCWANESWSRRWDGLENELLLKQEHSPEDDLRYAESVVRAFRDERYIRIDGRPLLLIYRPGIMPDPRATVDRWREYFISAGCGDPYIVMVQAFGDSDPRPYGMDAAAGFPPHKVGWNLPDCSGYLQLFAASSRVYVSSYDEMASAEIAARTTEYRMFPGVCPSWDNEARKPKRGQSFIGSTPQKYGDWLASAAAFAGAQGTADEKIVFINAWNEWAEGTYLEPDRHFGFAYLSETRRVLDNLSAPPGQERPRPAAPVVDSRSAPRISFRNRIRNKLSRTLRLS
jgi:hypothetical protein